jgi:hypothetical protein
MGLTPKFVDVVGQARRRAERELSPAKCSFWVHELEPESPTADLAQFLDRLAARLADKAPFLARLVAEGGDAEIFIGFFLERDITGFVLPASLQRRLADLHLDLNFDVYNYDEDEEVIPHPTPASS